MNLLKQSSIAEHDRCPISTVQRTFCRRQPAGLSKTFKSTAYYADLWSRWTPFVRQIAALKSPVRSRVSRSAYCRLNRRGALLVELVVCCLLLSTVSVILVPTIRKLYQQQKMIRFETLAMTALNNVAVDLDHSESLESLQIDAWFLDRYPDAKLSVERLSADKSLVRIKLTIWRPNEPTSNNHTTEGNHTDTPKGIAKMELASQAMVHKSATLKRSLIVWKTVQP